MGRCESNEVQRRRLCGRSSSSVVDGAPTFTLGTLVVSHVKHHITVAASRSESAQTGWPWGGSCGAEAVAVHGAMRRCWSSRSTVRLSSPDGAPRSRSPRRPFRTLSDQPQWLPVVQSRPRPAGNGVAGAMHLRSRDRGCTKEPQHEGAASAAPVRCPG